MQLKNAILGAISIFLIGCTCSKSTQIDVTLDESSFPQLQILSEKQLYVKPITSIADIAVIGDKLVVLNDYLRNDSVFMVFDVRTMECIEAWGNRGEGPSDYLSARIEPISDHELFVLDTRLRRTELWDLRTMQKKVVRIESDNSDLPQRDIGVRLGADSLAVIYDRFNPKSREIVSWNITRATRIVHDFSDLKQYSPADISGRLGVNFKQNKMVYAYSNMRRFDILDIDGRVLRRTNVTPNESFDPSNPHDPNHPFYYFDVVMLDDTFILYCRICSMNQFKDYRDGKGFTYFEQYDYDGNPVARYRTSSLLDSFCVTSKGDFIGYNSSAEQPFVLYSISKYE